MVRIFIDKKTTDPLIKLGVSQILSRPPTWDTSSPCIIDYYYWFHGSNCLYLYDGKDGKYWNDWKSKLVNILLTSQRIDIDGCAEGSWDPIDRWGKEGGRVYSTAINALTLYSNIRRHD